MSRFRNLLPLVMAAGVAAAILGTPSRADAGFTMTITDGTNFLTINDNGSGDLDPTSGVIIASGTVGVFNIQVDTGTSNAPGTPRLALLTQNNMAISSAGFTGTQTLTITLEDTGFTSPLGPNGMESQLSVTQLPASSTVTYQSFLDNQAGTLLTLNGVGGAKVVDVVNPTDAPFTLRSVTKYTIQGQGVGNTILIQNTGLTAVAPAPSSVILALAGVPVLGLGLRLRRRPAAEGVVAA